jgi:hypothetical protein
MNRMVKYALAKQLALLGGLGGAGAGIGALSGSDDEGESNRLLNALIGGTTGLGLGLGGLGGRAAIKKLNKMSDEMDSYVASKRKTKTKGDFDSECPMCRGPIRLYDPVCRKCGLDFAD